MTGRTDEPEARLGRDEALILLAHGELQIEGRIVDASNATLQATVSCDGMAATCVYKPVAGERPLWDFPDGTLAGREVAAYLVSTATGWDVVPPTVLRDGPYGPGMVQLWVDIDAGVDLVDVVAPGRVPASWCTVVEAVGERGRPVVLAHADDLRLRRMAVLDVVINNADRKGGHILAVGADPAAAVHGVDHGVCFNLDDKLRTVLWGWAGMPVTEEDADVLATLLDALDGALGTSLAEHLTRKEVARTRRRVASLLSRATMPLPSAGWPAIPWPAF